MKYKHMSRVVIMSFRLSATNNFADFHEIPCKSFIYKKQLSRMGFMKMAPVHGDFAHILQVFCPVPSKFGKGDVKKF